jgi:hypothetical protein
MALLQRECRRMKNIGKLCEGEPHAQFDEGEQGRPSGWSPMLGVS